MATAAVMPLFVSDNKEINAPVRPTPAESIGMCVRCATRTRHACEICLEPVCTEHMYAQRIHRGLDPTSAPLTVCKRCSTWRRGIRPVYV